MGIFNSEDEQRIRSIHEQRAIEDKKLFFEYFSDMAVNTVLDIVTLNKDVYVKTFEEHAQRYSTRNTRSIPILKFRTFHQTSIHGRKMRRDLQNLYCQIEPYGSYYHSLSGLHIVDLAAIYRNSNVYERVNEAIGSDMFYVSLTSTPDFEDNSVREYCNTLWLNIRV